MADFDFTPGIIFRIDKTASPTRIIPTDIKGVSVSAEWFSEMDKTIQLNVSLLITNAEIHLSDFKVDKTVMEDLGYLPFDKGSTMIAVTMSQTITDTNPTTFTPVFKIVGGKIGGAGSLRKVKKKVKK